MQIGEAAEAYVHYRLRSWGYDAHFASGLVSPFDIFIAEQGKIIRIQVKGTSYYKNYENENKYQFAIKKSSNGNRNKRYGDNDFDIVAMVGLPSERAFFSTEYGTATKRITCSKFNPEKERQTWEKCLDKILSAYDGRP